MVVPPSRFAPAHLHTDIAAHINRSGESTAVEKVVQFLLEVASGPISIKRSDFARSTYPSILSG